MSSTIIKPKDESKKLAQLLSVIQGKKTALIVSHTNPDPDAIASAMALQYLLQEIGKVKSTIAFDGIIGRAENRALIEYLELEYKFLEEIRPEHWDIVALIDTHSGMGNNPMPAYIPITIEIDHHPVSTTNRTSLFSDIRADFGATATILARYLLSAGLKIGTKLATALFYAIKAETQDLGREAKSADRRVYLTLYQIIDFRALAKIQRAELSPLYFQDMGRAIRRTKIFDDVAISAPGKVNNPEMVAELADTLLRLRDIRWAIVMGCCRGDMFISVRTKDADHDAGDLVKKVVGKMGTAGGHESFAGGKIPCEEDPRAFWRLKEKIQRRFLAELGYDRRRKGKKLIALEQ